MVSANLKIIEELKLFLNMVIEDSDIKSLFTRNSSDFTRNRKLPLEKIIGMLINLPKRSLSIELQSFFENLEQSDISCTKVAFSLQRTKLKPLFLKFWNDLLVKSFYAFYGSNVKRWEGFRLLAVDGSNINVMNVPEVLDHFGSADNQFGGVPMARGMQIHDVLNDIAVWGDIFPRSNSENSIIASNIRHLPADSLTLFDRGFPAFSLMYLLANEESPRHFLMRCKTTFSNEVKEFVDSNKTSAIVIMYPSAESIERLRENGYIVSKRTGIKVKILKVKLVDGEIEVLLTNLFDKKFTSKKSVSCIL